MRTERVPARKRQRGMTLFEVLGAVALLALVYTALATKANQGVMSETDTLRRFHASLLADEMLAEVETAAAMKETPDLGRRDVDSEDSIYQATVEVSEWSVPLPPEEETSPAAARNTASVLGGGNNDPGALLKVVARVSWDNGFGERSIERVTFVLDHARLLTLAPAASEGSGS